MLVLNLNHISKGDPGVLHRYDLYRLIVPVQETIPGGYE